MSLSNEEKFQNAYTGLNPEQRDAVDSIEGPVMVVAGPGTGKTQILALRIANIVRTTDTTPDSILALTFTESAVVNMRKRLLGLMGPDAYRVGIFTFHGFAQKIIQDNPDAFPAIIGSEPMLDVDAVRIIEDILITHDFEYLSPFGDPLLYVGDIRARIDNLKREGVSVQDFQAIIDQEQHDLDTCDDLYHEKGAYKGRIKNKYVDLQKQITKNQELCTIYGAYQDMLHAEKKYDFADMIMEVVRACATNQELLFGIQEQYHYVLVDEHQDSNNGQNKLLELLVNFHDMPNIFVVGDEKQSIFRFQGASLENFFYFKYLYPQAKLITLRTNYRSSQLILDSAESIIPSSKNLQAHHAYDAHKIRIMPFQETNAEVFGVIESIRKHIRDGVPPEKIAIIYRKNSDAFAFADMCAKLGVPCIIESDQDLFSDILIRKLITYMYAAAYPENDRYMGEALHVDFLGLDPFDIFQIIRTAGTRHEAYGVLTIYDILHRSDILDTLSLKNKDACMRAGAALADLHEYGYNDRITRTLEHALRASGMLAAIMASDEPVRGLDTVDRFFDEVRTLEAKKNDATLRDLIAHIEMIRKHKIFLKKKKHKGEQSAVRLMTAHRSKGLEFHYVYIVHAVYGVWGNTKSPNRLPLLPRVYALIDDASKKEIMTETFPDHDEELRIFYVALTRAEYGITITYAGQGDDGKEQLPSAYIDMISDDHKEYIDTTDLEALYKQERPTLYAEKPQGVYGTITPAFVRELFIAQGLSVSALNNYLKSPWQYFYRNLMRIPQTKTASLDYGNSMHAVFKDFFNHLKNGGAPSTDFLFELARTHVARLQATDREKEILLKKSLRALSEWYAYHQDVWHVDTINEERIRGIFLRDDVMIKGDIDKIELHGDGTVTVVDYKTGKHKTRNEIMGNTKNSDGDYYRQLVFYKLLLDRYKNGMYRMTEGVLEFVEPDENGKIERHTFTISEQETRELEATIIRVADEIMNLSFWNEPCDDAVCDYGDLVQALRGF